MIAKVTHRLTFLCCPLLAYKDIDYWSSANSADVSQHNCVCSSSCDWRIRLDITSDECSKAKNLQSYSSSPVILNYTKMILHFKITHSSSQSPCSNVSCRKRSLWRNQGPAGPATCVIVCKNYNIADSKSVWRLICFLGQILERFVHLPFTRL